MFKQFSSLRLQARLILLLTPALLVGALLAAAAMWTINLLDDQAHLLTLGVRDTTDANHAQIAASHLELAASNYLLTKDTDYMEEQDRMKGEIVDYFNRLTTYAQKQQDDQHPLNVGDALTGIGDKLAVYDTEWSQVAGAAKIDDAAIGHAHAALNAAVTLQSQLDSVYNNLLTAQLSRSNTIQQYSTAFLIAGWVGVTLFALLVIATAIMINTQVALPLALLQEAADRFARDEFNPASIQSLAGRSDEIGYLARSFLQMVEDVQAKEQVSRDQAAEYRTKIKNLSAR
jgi:methyl-accepting chemotaxis protein